jgi:hypothetical protein
MFDPTAAAGRELRARVWLRSVQRPYTAPSATFRMFLGEALTHLGTLTDAEHGS